LELDPLQIRPPVPLSWALVFIIKIGEAKKCRLADAERAADGRAEQKTSGRG
jgi:hypothetical protein